MIKEISDSAAYKNFGKLLNEVRYCRDDILITQEGKPMAALINVELFQKLCCLRNQFEDLTKEIEQAYENVKPEIAENELQEALSKIRSHS